MVLASRELPLPPQMESSSAEKNDVLIVKREADLVPLNSISWKNPPAKPNEAYRPTTAEQIANIFSHGICILPAVFCMWALCEKATTPTQLSAAVIYGLALILLFSVSAAFHTCCLCGNKKAKEVLHRGDRAMIYVFIASSWLPWLTLMPTSHEDSKFPPSMLETALGWVGFNEIVAADLRWAVWFLAAMGILYQHVFHEKYKWLETLFYITIGLIPAIPFLNKVDLPGMWELKLGGACYMLGVFFFKCDGRIPMAHAIWHLHVALGASIHYYAVFSYLMG